MSLAILGYLLAGCGIAGIIANSSRATTLLQFASESLLWPAVLVVWAAALASSVLDRIRTRLEAQP